MTKEAVAERARKLTHELEGWNTIRDDDVRHKFYELIERALAVCANEALEKAAQCAENQKLGTGPQGVAAAIRKLKAEG